MQLPSKNDFKTLISEIREACGTKISAVRCYLQHIKSRVETLENDHDATGSYITQLHLTVVSQSNAMRDMQRHLEDLDNQGCRSPKSYHGGGSPCYP